MAWSAEAFARAPSVGAVVVAAPPGQEAEIESAVTQAVGELALTVVTGDATRAESVARGLEPVASDLVAVHDAARPLTTPELIEALIAAVASDSRVAGAIAATPVTDTVKRAEGDPPVIAGTEDRTRLWAAQTPQVFRTEELRRAHAGPGAADATDDAMLIEASGGRVAIEPAGPENLKVTTQADLRLAELLLADR